MEFKQWLESSLKGLLEPVPQSPIHHKEGNVYVHTRMVRKQLDSAVSYFQQLVNTSPVFSNLDPNLSKEDINILRIGAFLHDIGKASATTNVNGVIKAIGHEDPEHFEPMMQKLGSPWKEMYLKASPEDKEILWYIIENHMSFKEAFSRKILLQYLDNTGKFINDRKIKLLIILIMMDQSGRIKLGELSGKEALPQIGNRMHQSTEDWFKSRRPASQPAPDDRDEFLKILQSRGLTQQQIQQALKGKFGS